MPSYETDDLAELARKKLDCLTRLRDMGRKQFELVRSGDMGELLDVLAAKQRVLWQLQRVERAMDRFRDQDPDQRQWRSCEQRTLCRVILDQCERLLGEIMSEEKQSEQELLRRRDQAAACLQGSHLAGRARGAYLAEASSSEPQLDLSTGD
jgi:hypothetical protein